MPDASFLMVGDGPSFEEAVASTEDEPRIHVVGFRDDIETAYAAMDVLVLASAWEGLPRTVLEAGAAGVPVVSTDVSGVSEVVRNERDRTTYSSKRFAPSGRCRRRPAPKRCGAGTYGKGDRLPRWDGVLR